jgi:hypothetical protein
MCTWPGTRKKGRVRPTVKKSIFASNNYFPAVSSSLRVLIIRNLRVRVVPTSTVLGTK